MKHETYTNIVEVKNGLQVRSDDFHINPLYRDELLNAVSEVVNRSPKNQEVLSKTKDARLHGQQGL